MNINEYVAKILKDLETACCDLEIDFCYSSSGSEIRIYIDETHIIIDEDMEEHEITPFILKCLITFRERRGLRFTGS